MIEELFLRTALPLPDNKIEILMETMTTRTSCKITTRIPVSTMVNS